MKKSTHFALVLIFFTLPLISTAQMQIGIRGGYNLASLTLADDVTGSSTSTFGFKGGLCFGASLEIPLGSGLALSLEPQYLQKGVAQTSYYNGAIEGIIKATMPYFELPVLIKPTILSLENFEINGAIGLSLGYTSTFHYVVTDKTGLIVSEADYTITPTNFNKLDISAVGGIGFKYKIGSGSLTFDTRYGYGLTNTTLNPSDTSFKSANRVIAFFLGYQFKL
jgi:hypothetical protein